MAQLITKFGYLKDNKTRSRGGYAKYIATREGVEAPGVEGYMESAASGILAGWNAAAAAQEREPLVLPATTMMGALSRHVGESVTEDFQPMGANFGVLPPLEPHIRDKRERYAALADRSLKDLELALSACQGKDGIL